MIDPYSKTLFINERELLDYIKEHPDELLEGSRFLGTEYSFEMERVDGILIDSERTIWILEMKTRLDELQINQALRIYDWITQNMDIVYHKLGNQLLKVEETHKIGLILVAPAFSIHTSRLVKYLHIPILLVTYTAFQDDKGETRIQIGEYYPEKKPPPLDITLVVMAYMLELKGVEPSLEKIGMWLKGLYSPNDLYDEAIRLSRRGVVHVGVTHDDEHGVRIANDSARLAEELYELYWKRLEIVLERR